MIRGTLYLMPLLLWTWTVAAGEVTWLTDLDQGRRQAREQRKELLILFTGTAWCGFCTQLDYEVLDRSDFARIANTMVLVKLEFPAANELLPPATKEKYIAWRNEFGIVGFPTLFLADSAGRPYAVTGCTGEPVKEYVDRLEALRTNRNQRDEALEQARNSRGPEAARHLDRALDAVADGIGDNYRTPEGSYLAWFYRGEIDRILAADADDAQGLRTKYRTLLDDTQQKRIQTLLDQLATTRREQGEEAAIELIRTELARADSEPVAAQLRVSLVSYLESAERYSEALETVLQFAALPQIEPNRRRVLKGQAASLLQELGRDEEALMMYDEAIHEVGEHDPKAVHSLDRKARLFARLGRLEEAEATWKRAERCVKAGTLDWREVQIFRGRLLSKLGKHSEALAVFTNLSAETDIGASDRALALGELAVALGLAGQAVQADARAAEVESLLEGLTSPEDVDLVKLIRGRLRVARGQQPAGE